VKRKLRHPIRSITEPYGKAGLTVAIFALVLATTGAAFAAVGLSSKQKKEVAKIAKKYAGKPGAPGATGPAGSPGTNGTNGKDGASGTSATTASFTGVKGTCTVGGVEVKSASPTVNVCNGQTGFTETLPSEKTETGTWSHLFAPAEEGVVIPVSFSIPLAAELDSSHVHIAPNAECPGTVAEPKAQKGNLCVYIGFNQFGLSPGTGALDGIDKPGPLERGAARSGAILLAENTSASQATQFGGTWAVTAP
jgi:hypothetical protein